MLARISFAVLLPFLGFGLAVASTGDEIFVKFEDKSEVTDQKAYLTEVIGVDLTVFSCHPDPFVYCLVLPDGTSMSTERVVEVLSDDPNIAFVSKNEPLNTDQQNVQTQTQGPVSGNDPILDDQTQGPVTDDEDPIVDEPDDQTQGPDEDKDPIVDHPDDEDDVDLEDPPEEDQDQVVPPTGPDSLFMHWGLHKIDIPAVHEQFRGDGQGLIAVISTGIDTKHEALEGVIYRNSGEIAGNGVDDDANGYIDDVSGYNFLANNGDISDLVGQGTMVAGLIAGTRNVPESFTRIYGVNEKASILPIKVNDGNRIVFAWTMFRAFDYALAMGAKVIYFGFDLHALFLPDWGPKQWFQYICDRAEEEDAMIVAPAGDYGRNLDSFFFRGYPAGLRSNALLTVGSSTIDDAIAESSNYGGQSVDLFAPGQNLLCLTSAGGYNVSSGTALSAGLTAGVVYMLREDDPNADLVQVRNRLLNAVDPMPGMLAKSRSDGRLNAYRALFGEDSETSRDFAVYRGCLVDPTNGSLSLLSVFLIAIMVLVRYRRLNERVQ